MVYVLMWLKDALISSKTLFLVASVSMFLGKISIWIGEQSKEDHHPTIEEGGGRASSLSLLELRHPFSAALGHGCSWFFWTQVETYTISPGFSGLWTRTELYYSFSNSLVCGWKTMGLLGLHKICEPIPILNLI